MSSPLAKRVVARAILLVTALVVSAAAGELLLRVVYRDAGRRTLGGPGGVPFEHLTRADGLRGRRDVGPKIPGVPRIMIVGDSLTYGLGVRDWHDSWPERLAVALEQSGRRHEVAVFATPGADMPHHVQTMREWARRAQPDIVIYQWYINDIEAISHRPDPTMFWERSRWHPRLRSASYLYYVLDYRLALLLQRLDQRYLRYLRDDFAPGTLEWTEFEREFHEFALRAGTASRRLLLLFPYVPFRGRYPLQALHDRMRVLAAPHVIRIPPSAWRRAAGRLSSAANGPGQLVHAVDSRTGLDVETSDYVLKPGPLDVVIGMLSGRNTKCGGGVEARDPANRAVLSAAPVAIGRETSRDMHVRLEIPGDAARRVSVRVTLAAGGECSLTSIAIPVGDDFEVIDMTDRLNDFDTHASSFDAHPNERAHQVIAETVLKALDHRLE
jgi:hypothetical protein